VDIDNKNKGFKAEMFFSNYLDRQKIPYYRVDQNQKTYSNEFYKKNIRRPDYIIHTEKGLFCIDVKYRKKMNYSKKGERRFYLNQNEINSLFNFQINLKADVWISFIEDLENMKFFYAPISDIFEYYQNIIKIIEDGFFMELKKDAIDENDDLVIAFKDRLILIPETLLYDHLSFEKGFYKTPDINLLKAEADHHVENWITQFRIECYSKKE